MRILSRDFLDGLHVPQVYAPGLHLECGPGLRIGQAELEKQGPSALIGFDPQRLAPGPFGKRSLKHQGVSSGCDPDLHRVIARLPAVP